jgi:exosome complex exonuclease DIS3/RRP44
MDKDANIKDVRFHKSVIHSVASLTYDEAQTMIDSPSQVDRVNVSVCTLNHLAKM